MDTKHEKRRRAVAHLLGSRRRRVVAAASLAVAAAATVGVTTAQAVTGFHTSASSVRIRAAATTDSAQVGVIGGAGTALDITCQTLAQTISVSGFGTSAVWDRIDSLGGYISDLFVRETAYAQLDNRIPHCADPAPAPTPAPAPAPQTREAKAYAWALSEVGRRLDDWGRPTAGWCAQWSVGAYGRTYAGYLTAYKMFLAFRAQGLVHSGRAPAGAFVFFAAAPINKWAGHVAIADDQGGMITTSTTIIQHRPLSYALAPYLGWSYAPPGWTR